jgi:hypothetical protein
LSLIAEDNDGADASADNCAGQHCIVRQFKLDPNDVTLGRNFAYFPFETCPLMRFEVSQETKRLERRNDGKKPQDRGAQVVLLSVKDSHRRTPENDQKARDWKEGKGKPLHVADRLKGSAKRAEKRVKTLITTKAAAGVIREAKLDLNKKVAAWERQEKKVKHRRRPLPKRVKIDPRNPAAGTISRAELRPVIR